MKFKLIKEEQRKFKMYTNGTKTIRVYDGDPIPDGFYPGQHHSHPSWNKGLTADTDERVKKNVEASHFSKC